MKTPTAILIGCVTIAVLGSITALVIAGHEEAASAITCFIFIFLMSR